ncbi:MAG: hypothetical protein KAU58_03975, partial [Candidatus Omnitrophica bacterium]|nr:hypothetical protein [Candidatus Omnitrophota bacterium]
TVPRILSIQGFRQEAALNKVKADLKYVMEFAINNSCRTRVVYNATGDTSYTATTATDWSGPWNDMTDPTTHTSPFTVTLNTGNYLGVKITNVNFDGQAGIEFDSIGRPYSYDGGSAALLSGNGSVTLTGGRSITITVDTGRIY